MPIEKLNANDPVFVEDAPKVKVLLEPPPLGLAVLLDLGNGNLNMGFPCSGVTTADAGPPVLGVAPNSAFDACFGVFTSEAMSVPETLEGELLDEAGVVRCTGVDMGVFDIQLVDPGVLVCWEPTALNRLEEVGFTMSTSEEPTPRTGAGTSEVEVTLLDDCPAVSPNLKSGFDVWLGETESACMFASNVVLPETFEVPATLRGFDVPPMVPRTDVDG